MQLASGSKQGFLLHYITEGNCKNIIAQINISEQWSIHLLVFSGRNEIVDQDYWKILHSTFLRLSWKLIFTSFIFIILFKNQAHITVKEANSPYYMFKYLYS